MSAGFCYGEPSTESVVGAFNAQCTAYLDAVCAELDINVTDVIGYNNHRPIADLRHVLMYVFKHEFHMTFMEIAQFMRRNHASIIHGEKKIGVLLKTNQINVFLGQCLQAAERVYIEQWGQSPKSISWHTTKKFP